MNENEFRTLLADKGYGDVGVKEWDPNSDGEFHTHEFSALLMVTRGEFRVVLEDEVQTFGPGEWCDVPAGTVHYEQTGADGATVLAGRK
jgi:quercetin dioxygenase-like cupin family protein